MAKFSPFGISLEDVASLPPDAKMDKVLEKLNVGSGSVAGALSKGLTFTDNFAATLNTITVNMPSSEWVTPTLENSWTSTGNNGSVGYRKTMDGHLQIRGEITTAGAINTTAFTLPAAYRPKETTVHVSISNGAIGWFRVFTDGTVVPVSGSITSFAINSPPIECATRTVPAPSVFPIYYETKINNTVFKPRGVLVVGVVDRDDPSQLPGITGPALWEFDGKSGVKIKNIPGLAYNRKYSVTLLNIAG